MISQGAVQLKMPHHPAIDTGAAQQSRAAPVTSTLSDNFPQSSTAASGQGFRSYAHRMSGGIVACPRQQRLAQILCNLRPLSHGRWLPWSASTTIDSCGMGSCGSPGHRVGSGRSQSVLKRSRAGRCGLEVSVRLSIAVGCSPIRMAAVCEVTYAVLVRT